MQPQVITREQVIDLVRKMPSEKLGHWYEYGLFIQSQPLYVAPAVIVDEITPYENKVQLHAEFALWEAASDKEWVAFENKLAEVA